MKNFTATDARAHLSDLMNRVSYGREFIGLTVRDEVRAVMVHPDFVKDARAAFEKLETLDAEAAADRVLSDPTDETIPWSPRTEAGRAAEARSKKSA